MATRLAYNDMFTGQVVNVKERKKRQDAMEKFWENGNYRKATKDDIKKGLSCAICKNIVGEKKCTVVGVTDSSASDIDRGFVCDFFKSNFAEKK